MPTFYLVELFSGSSSVARGARAALPPNWKMKVHSVDIHPKYKPTTATDISTWHYKPVLDEFLAKAGDKDVVWVHASPPCTEYSKAKTTAPRDLPLADSLVKRSLKIIKHVDPDFWSIENPVGLMRTRPFMQDECGRPRLAPVPPGHPLSYQGRTRPASRQCAGG